MDNIREGDDLENEDDSVNNDEAAFLESTLVKKNIATKKIKEL